MARVSTSTTALTRRPALTTLSAFGLLGVTAVWGSTFFLLKDVVERVPVTDFLAVRFAIAALAVWLIAPRSLSRLTAVERRNGVLLGLVYGGAQVLQTVGLQSTSASVSGFVTGMYVVFTPLLGAVLLQAWRRPLHDGAAESGHQALDGNGWACCAM